MTDIHTSTFRGHEFRFQRGTVHPQYSIDCFTADEKEFRDKYWLVEPGDVVVDAGASYGAYSLTAAAVGAHVIAFEPEPTVWVDLQANIDLNGWRHCCEACCSGLLDASGPVDMDSYAPHWPQGTVTRPFNMRRLDNIDLPQRIDWFKLDIEGAEERALRGAMRTIAKFRPTLIVESHIFLDHELTEKCKAVIREASGDTYSFEIVQRDPCEMIVCRPEKL